MTSATEKENELVQVAACITPTEAYMLKGTLQAAGVEAFVVGDNFIRMNVLVAADAAVRVMVRQDQAEEARRTLEAFHAGELKLEEDDGEMERTPAVLSRPIFSPEGAIFWSLLLTPVFGAVLHLMNAGAIGDAKLRRSTKRWAFFLIPLTLLAFYAMLKEAPDPSAPLRLGPGLMIPTAIWYVLAGRRQGRYVLQVFGPGYARRSLTWPVILGMLVELVLAGAISFFER